MFGDVGGLFDFILIGLSSVFSYLAHSSLSASLVSKLFHASDIEPKEESKNATLPLKALHSIEIIPFSATLAAFDACSCRLARKKSRRLRTLELGEAKLDQSLDFVKLVRQIRILRTLTLLVLSKEE